MLSAKNLTEEKNYGDCTIIDYGQGVVVYDCGCEEFANEVIRYIDDKGFEKVDIVLSHNDADHFDGIPTLIKNNRVASITTLLLFKYVDEIYEKIDDHRKTRDSIKKQIEELYDNIFSLSGNNLRDALGEDLFITNEIKVVGPDKDYFIEAVAKHLDTTESDYIDGETIMNAISIQLQISFGNQLLLLTGDANIEAINNKVTNYDAIQLPHHGKPKWAEEIFELNKGRNSVTYLVSDNTKSSNGGSDDLSTQGHRVKNTKNGEIIFDNNSFEIKTTGNYGI